MIEKAINAINANLEVTELKYVMTVGDQDDVDTFGDAKTKTTSLRNVSTSTVKYDLVGEIAKRTTLTRRTACAVLKGIQASKLAMFRNNPEEFIKNVSKLIKDEKATMIVEHIAYNRLNETYDSDIFTQENKDSPSARHIQRARVFRIMCLPTDWPKRAWKSALPNLWMAPPKCAFMPNYREHFKFPPPSATIRPTGPLPSMREL